MKNYVSVIASTFFLITVGTVTSAQDAAPDFSGEWWNERCSHMNLVVNGDDLSGQYWTGVGSGIGDAFKLVGFTSGDLIAFSVNFGDQGSLTSWAGQHTVIEGEEKIPTFWHLAANLSSDADEPATLWRSVWTGSNNYVRAKPSSC